MEATTRTTSLEPARTHGRTLSAPGKPVTVALGQLTLSLLLFVGACSLYLSH